MQVLPKAADKTGQLNMTYLSPENSAFSENLAE